MKVTKSLENREILLKGTAKKITCQKRGFLNFLRPYMTVGSPLMKSVLTPLVKNVLIPLGLPAGISADATIQKNIYGSGTRALIISNEEMKDIIKKVKSREEPGLLIKGISEKIKNEAKEQKCGFLAMILGTLAASLLGSALIGRGVIRADEGVIRANQNF